MKLRKLFYWLGSSALVLVVLLVAATAIFFSPNCQSDSRHAEFARSIPPSRLAKLFEDVRRLGPWIGRVRRDEIPVEFSELGVIAIGGASLPGIAHLRLNGCFDHHLDLVVIGADGESRGDPRIELIWGEVPDHGAEVLWRLDAK